MDIIQESIDELNGKIKVKIVEQDYMPKVEIALKDYTKKASIPGFRPGKTPKSLIMKKYGKSLIEDEVFRLMQDSLNNYITEKDLDIMARPVLNREETRIDFENQKEFEFLFDIGYSPKFDAQITSADKIAYEIIKVDDALVESQMNDLAKRYGKVMQAESVENGDMINGAYVELDANGEIKEGGIFKQDGYLFMDRIKDEGLRNKFIGLKKEEKIVIPVKEIADNAADLAGSLGIDKTVAEGVTADFQFTIKGISRVSAAELNQEFFNKMFGEGVVNSIEEFRQKIREELAERFKSDSDNRLYNTAVEYLRKKIQFNLPSEFLKKYLLENNEEGLTKADMDSEFDKYESSWKWELIESKIAAENNITVTREELFNYFKGQLIYQFRQYNIPLNDESVVDKRAEELLADSKNASEARFNIRAGKMIELFKTKFGLENKEVSMEEFSKKSNNN